MGIKVPLTSSYIGISVTPSEMVTLLNTGKLGADYCGDNELVLEVLSDQNATGDFRDFVLRQRRFYEWRDAGPHPDGKILRTILDSQNATGDFLLWLRRFVDEWLDTARNSDGSESPETRDVNATRLARVAVRQYLQKWPPLPVLGTQSAFVIQPLESVLYPRGPLDAQQLATYFFTQLVFSAWQETICKCRYTPCGKYFRKPKPRAVYIRGTCCCRECANKLSAMQKVFEDRQRRRARLLELARETLRKLQCRQKSYGESDLKRKIVEQVIQHLNLRRDAPVTVKWVTRNWAKITAPGDPDGTR